MAELVASGWKHNFGPCQECGAPRSWHGSPLCTQCRAARKAAAAKQAKREARARIIAMNKARSKWTEPVIEKTRTKAWTDLSTTAPSDQPVRQYKPGTVKFWHDWYYNQHDEESFRRWEERLGLSHDVPMFWDSDYGVGYRPQYPKKNTVL